MMAQYSAPPLSYPLVVKSFHKYFGKQPDELFDTFTRNAINAASIGQVHQATYNGKKLAVKIQYPGVAESISSDLRIAKPFAKRLFNVSEADLEHYMVEVEQRLLEETDYKLELKRSMDISEACAALDNVHFPTYYPEFSSERILTMDWLSGHHLDEFMAQNPSQEVRNSIGQAIWDFYDFQTHVLKMIHADAHPGNFLFRTDGSVAVLDFGCVKVIPEDFYQRYFKIHDKAMLHDPAALEHWLYDLNFLSANDTPEEKVLFKSVFTELISLLGRPFHEDAFDFGNNAFFEQIYALGERLSKMKEIRNSKNARGHRDALYVNRTYFGLYFLLNTLGAHIQTGDRSYRLKSA
jgi:predicted unusual protein kinase regulating ubiquinone biosynthesis (AarF/ABC1/UbiB family)